LGEIAILCGQIIVLQFVVSNRSSTQWCYVAVAFAMMAVFFCRFLALKVTADATDLSTGQLLRTQARRIPDIGRIVVVGLLLLAVAGSVRTVQKARIDESYFTGGNRPYHLFWHNAFIALTFHPEWNALKPSPDIPDGHGDDVGFAFFQREMT